MQRILLLCAWLCLSGTLAAQTLTVLDAESGEPVIFATIFSANPNVSAETNFEGQADITAFKGAAKVEIGMLGYSPFNQSYAELEAADFVVRLEPTAIGLNVLVVSGTRWEQTSGTVASKIVSIRPEEVALQNPQTAADLLGLSGKVFIQKSQ
ncbi:MAG: TonB-dependent receptor, partial [Phaeodactylibacter sp.]|nr:TonB-dependent receptor [Phaeodactylibacter sp.]